MTSESDINLWAVIIGPCYTAASLSRSLDWAEGEIAEAASNLALLELVTNDGVLLYPVFQVWEGRPVHGLLEVLQQLSTGTHSRWTWAQWLNAPFDDDSGEPSPSAIEQLRAGKRDEVLRDATQAAAAWRS